MKYTFHPHARKELDRAVAYYDSRSQETGESFFKETSESISRILNFPEAWAKIRGEVRRCRVNRFPYDVLYEIEGSHISILAVMHSHRKPDYWSYRE
jgi:plasmid stabilization system protein ParE